MKEESSKIISSDVSVDITVDQIMLQMSEDQSQTRAIIQCGFIGLATQNENLYRQNQELQEQLASLQEDFEVIKTQLQKKLKAEQVLEKQRERYKKRKRLPKREPITKEVYEFFISETNRLDYSNSFRGARLRLALALLLVTGVRISELLPLKLDQVQTLLNESWIAIDRVKRGPASHKAFLTKEGKQMIKNRRKDLEMISYFKDANSFIFTAENSNKPLQREAWNRVINSFIKDCVHKLDNKPLLRSHSFRIGFITQLWKDSNDIEFVRQTIGHASLDTTSNYVKTLSEEDRQKRMLKMGDRVTKITASNGS